MEADSFIKQLEEQRKIRNFFKMAICKKGNEIELHKIDIDFHTGEFLKITGRVKSFGPEIFKWDIRGRSNYETSEYDLVVPKAEYDLGDDVEEKL